MPRRLLRLLTGLVLYGFADAMMIAAAIGVDPWTVFAQGVAVVTGIGVGWLTNLIGLAVLLLWIPLRQRPGLGTLVNIVVIGPSIELGLWLIPEVSGLGARVALFTAGLVLLAVASGLYIGARLGPGPRDGLMTGLRSRFGWPLWLARGGVELSVLGVGWALGGNVGVGTIAFALLIGPLCGLTVRSVAGPVAAAAPAVGPTPAVVPTPAAVASPAVPEAGASSPSSVSLP